ncbi:MAG: DUF2953 domain-containing protein [Deltaproteobacteria bacterium]|nr:DUF2953 domain-containing protein [Deltaproteobacteria bacterium]
MSLPELLFLLLCLSALALLLWLYLAPLELEGELRRERGEQAEERLEGELRLKLGPVSLRAVPADPRRSGRSWQLELRLAGLRLARWKTEPPEGRTPLPEKERRPREATRPSLAWVRRHWDLGELLQFLFAHRRLMEIGPLEGRLEFGLEDPALTGELYGWACAARQMSPALAGVDLQPLWLFDNACWGWLRGRVRARLFALLAALAFHLATRYRRDPGGSAQGPELGGGAAAT